MNNKTIFIAPPGARRKREHIFNELISLCPENDFSSVQYICPNSFIISEAERDFFDFIKKTVYIPFQAMMLKPLGERLYSESFNESPVSEITRPLILCEILKEKNTGYARLLSDLYKKIKQYIPGKDLSQIKDETISLIFEDKAAKRAGDAIETLILYEDELKKRGLVDSEEMLKKSISLIKKYLNPSITVIDGFFDPSPLELQMIEALMEKAVNAYLLVEEGSGIYKYFGSDKKKLRARKLHSSIHRKNTGYYSYPSIEEEAESIVKTAKGLILEGTDPWEIIVTFPDLKKYTPILKRVFKKHGIPLTIEEFDLSSSGPLMLLDAIFTCMEEDYPAYDFLSLLTSPDFPGMPAVIKEWAVAYTYRAGVVKGRESWLSIKETIINTLPEEHMEDEAVKLDDFQNGIRMVIETIEGLGKKDTLSSFLDALEDALKRYGFFEALKKSSDTDNMDNIHEMLIARFSELRIFDERYKPVIHDAGTSVFYLRHLLKDLKGFTGTGDGVRAVPLELAAGAEAEMLFFGGVIEEDFPSRPMIDPILPERVKKELGLPDLEYYLGRQKNYFRRMLNISRRDPYFSCPSADGDNLLLPSPFLDWDAVMPAAPMNIFSEEDLLVMDGSHRHLNAGPGVFWNDVSIKGREAWGELQKRAGSIIKGYISVTGIDSYRRCPLRFYMEKILDITVEEPPRFDVEARLWGNLAHKTMEYLFKEGDVEIEEMEERLLKGLNNALKKFPIGRFWSNVAEEIFRRLMPLLKEQERDIRAEGFVPHDVEIKIEAEVNGLRLRGKIDRIDLKTQNPEPRTQNSEKKQEKKTVRILDYKTGNPDKNSLQLPLYASMWQKNNTDDIEKTGLYSFRQGKITWYPSKGRMKEYIEEALIKAEEVVGNIKKGIFLPEPHSTQECRYCYHSPLCEGAK